MGGPALWNLPLEGTGKDLRKFFCPCDRNPILAFLSLVSRQVLKLLFELKNFDVGLIYLNEIGRGLQESGLKATGEAWGRGQAGLCPGTELASGRRRRRGAGLGGRKHYSLRKGSSERGRHDLGLLEETGGWTRKPGAPDLGSLWPLD